MFTISRTADEQDVFRRFMQTQPDLAGAGWRYDGAHHKRPHFVHPEEKIGVELGEWLDPKQTRAARELDRFEREINQALNRQGPTEFRESFKPSSTARYGVLLDVAKVPSRREKVRVIEALLDHLRTAEKPKSDRERRLGIGCGPAEMPRKLSSFFSFIRITEGSRNISLGVSLSRTSSFDPNDAVNALLDLLKDKLSHKRCLYQKTKADKRLRQLWLVLHYGRAMRWNTPYDGLGLREGRPLDETTNRQIIKERARRLIGEIGSGPFNKVFLLFDMTPGFECLDLFP